MDAGANIGLYSLWMAQLVGTSGRVDAFEGSAKACVRLRENVMLNCLQDLIEVHEAAISNRPGKVKFSLDYDVSNAIVPPGASRGNHRWVEVNAVVLDDVVDWDCALAKVDVEGAEAHLLDGWTRSLEDGKVAVVLLEALANQLAKQGETIESLFGRLRALGFALMRFDAGSGTLSPIPLPFNGGNLLAIHRSKLDFVKERLASAAT